MISQSFQSYDNIPRNESISSTATVVVVFEFVVVVICEGVISFVISFVVVVVVVVVTVVVVERVVFDRLGELRKETSVAVPKTRSIIGPNGGKFDNTAADDVVVVDVDVDVDVVVLPIDCCCAVDETDTSL